tara:strand:+ start:145 stop:630 length:486 start_codon:yes stop_codon:yes gene_type:complete
MASQRFILTALTAVVLCLAGCRDADETSFDRMSNGTLSEQAYQCRNTTSEMAPGRAVACGNVERICRSRSKRDGYLVCLERNLSCLLPAAALALARGLVGAKQLTDGVYDYRTRPITGAFGLPFGHQNRLALARQEERARAAALEARIAKRRREMRDERGF